MTQEMQLNVNFIENVTLYADIDQKQKSYTREQSPQSRLNWNTSTDPKTPKIDSLVVFSNKHISLLLFSFWNPVKKTLDQYGTSIWFFVKHYNCLVISCRLFLIFSFEFRTRRIKQARGHHCHLKNAFIRCSNWFQNSQLHKMQATKFKFYWTSEYYGTHAAYIGVLHMTTLNKDLSGRGKIFEKDNPLRQKEIFGREWVILPFTSRYL